ncbi:TIGR03013 family XrtA/PEP-CTERM system glycosyltransferase [Sphingosinicella xenopeptidilytica]|uniref:TIGR03013 family XrtA/PEP-CTERM system glycosyltransferase n=1 Tax=Sphingosinicella xenopeptidilytica TaxID=364098 RepID=A0ABW3C913_SPHXN|nr:TIGR03013 family PEP-CTERM/XrtA system glycosyltransferase [Sphingosinicella sp.]
MIRLFNHYLPRPLLILGLIEIVLIYLSAQAAWLFRTQQIDMDPGSIAERAPQFALYALTVYLVMLGIGAYQMDCFRSLRMAMSRLAVAMLVSITAISVILFFFPDVDLWRSVVLYAIALTFVVIFAWRVLMSRIVKWKSFRFRVLIIGAGQRGARLARAAEASDSNFTAAAVVRLTNTGNAIDNAIPIDSVPSLVDLCEQLRIDEVVLALDERRGAAPSEKLLEVKLAGFPVSEISSFLERQTGRVDLRSISPSWLIYSDGFLGAEPVSIMLKRLFDVTASLILLVLASPILILAALAVKLTSRGDTFYRQERVGQFGKTFNVVKFRSMVADAEKDGKAQWAKSGDPRVTPVGRILRASRIDEIPQIYNVLTGDMSFVGPRPERPVFVEELAAEIPYYRERHIVKPGITGWAQLNYPYGASVMDARHKLEYDLYYIKNYSLFLDLLILIQTVRVVVWQDGVR